MPLSDNIIYYSSLNYSNIMPHVMPHNVWRLSCEYEVPKPTVMNGTEYLKFYFCFVSTLTIVVKDKLARSKSLINAQRNG